MASTERGSKSPSPQPRSTTTKYYFAYGSNLHLRQMKRRCPNSKFIGCARLANYRWQINERGYANVLAADGHWVDGLVYEIDEKDEAKLDINEGVAKNAYEKRYMTVLLHRAPSDLYRRPTSWIVDKGGPAKILAQSKEDGKLLAEHPKQWQKDVLVYISPSYIEDSEPKEEYVNRINLGVKDAAALGLEDDYIQNCIRPYVPTVDKPLVTTSRKSEKGKKVAQEPKKSATKKIKEPSPARQQSSARSDEQDHPPKASSSGNYLKKPSSDERRAASDVGVPPSQPPRASHSRARSIPTVIVTELVTAIYRSRK